MGQTLTCVTITLVMQKVYVPSLTFYASDMVLAHDTSSYHDDHLCQIILKSYNAGQNYGCVVIVYAQSSHAPCDLDHQDYDIFLVHDISSCDDGHLCHKILKSNHEG